MARSFPQKMVLDTSAVGRVIRSRRAIALDDDRGRDQSARIEAASLAISVVTVAEVRFGYRVARWGTRRISEAESRLAVFSRIPIDAPEADEWSRLAAAAQTQGVALSGNDLWIAATANVRGHALITCDRDHLRMAPDLDIEVVFLAPPV